MLTLFISENKQVDSFGKQLLLLPKLLVPLFKSLCNNVNVFHIQTVNEMSQKQNRQIRRKRQEIEVQNGHDLTSLYM